MDIVIYPVDFQTNGHILDDVSFDISRVSFMIVDQDVCRWLDYVRNNGQTSSGGM
jgi:hypothetical protein